MNTLYHLNRISDNIHEITWNAEHDFFTGHYPGNPIVPASLLIEIVAEILRNPINQFKEYKVLAPMKPEQKIYIKIESQTEKMKIIVTDISGKLKARMLIS